MATINQALNILRKACGNFAVDMKSDDAYFCESVITIKIPYGISLNEEIEEPKSYKIPEVREVRYNGSATIVFWEDNTKTVVKMQPGEKYYDPDKAFAMAVCKKLFGNKFNRHLAKAQKAFEKHCEEEHEKQDTVIANDSFNNIANAFYSDAWKVFDPFINCASEEKKED